jgi:hypothetical protein
MDQVQWNLFITNNLGEKISIRNNEFRSNKNTWESITKNEH